jgi:hypothetical protein
MNDSRYRPLNEKEQHYICQFIRILVPIARDDNHPMRDIARWQIALTMWRWTADAVDTRSGSVKGDAFKYNVGFHSHTRKACEAARAGSGGLRHEHVVPRAFLADEIIRHDMSAEDIHKFLHTWCRVVIVTKDEDDQIRPRARMPDGWGFITGDLYQRYIDAGLKQEICDIVHK